MLRFKALLLFVLMVCPLAFCYGQFHFATVNGDDGYVAMRGDYRLDLDNGFILLPTVGYYRMSDREEDESGATTKFALNVRYEISDNLLLSAGAEYIPERLGFQEVAYGIGAKYNLCYHCGIFSRPYVKINAGQARYRIDAYATGAPLGYVFKTVANAATAEAGTEIGPFFVQARYDKVIKYSDKPNEEVAGNWTDIPFMTAVVQGFVRDIAAARVAYRTKWITPYVVYSRYKYLLGSDYTVSVAGGLALTVGETTLTGGVEIFEQNHKDQRKTYFSLSASTQF